MGTREQFMLDGTKEVKILGMPTEQCELWLGGLDKAPKKPNDHPDQMHLFDNKVKGMKVVDVAVLRRGNNK